MPSILFNSETARIAAYKSAESRRANPPRQFHPQEPELSIVQNPAQLPAQAVIETQLRIVREQIRHTRKDLNDAQLDSYGFCEHCKRHGMLPHHKAQLVKALDALLARECKLMMIAEPANVKVNSKPSHTQTQDIEPG